MLFLFELLAAAASQRVEARLAVIFRDAPLCFDPAALFNPVKGGIQRALLDLKHILGKLMNSLPDAVAVHRSERQRLENQQIESALGEIRFLF
jgi:hypothetical protein